jgi:hypothetical protein
MARTSAMVANALRSVLVRVAFGTAGNVAITDGMRQT